MFKRLFGSNSFDKKDADFQPNQKYAQFEEDKQELSPAITKPKIDPYLPKAETKSVVFRQSVRE